MSVRIFGSGGGGVITDATAIPDDVSSGKIFYNNDGKQVGMNPTVKPFHKIVFTLNEGTSYNTGTRSDTTDVYSFSINNTEGTVIANLITDADTSSINKVSGGTILSDRQFSFIKSTTIGSSHDIGLNINYYSFNEGLALKYLSYVSISGNSFSIEHISASNMTNTATTYQYIIPIQVGTCTTAFTQVSSLYKPSTYTYSCRICPYICIKAGLILSIGYSWFINTSELAKSNWQGSSEICVKASSTSTISTMNSPITIGYYE